MNEGPTSLSEPSDSADLSPAALGALARHPSSAASALDRAQILSSSEIGIDPFPYS